MEGIFLKTGGKNIQFKKALASESSKKVQRKCQIMFFIPNVVLLESIMTQLLSLYIYHIHGYCHFVIKTLPVYDIFVLPKCIGM